MTIENSDIREASLEREGASSVTKVARHFAIVVMAIALVEVMVLWVNPQLLGQEGDVLKWERLFFAMGIFFVVMTLGIGLALGAWARPHTTRERERLASSLVAALIAFEMWVQGNMLIVFGMKNFVLALVVSNLILTSGAVGVVLFLRRKFVAAPKQKSDPFSRSTFGFYFNREDPAVFVPKKYGNGYTLNFAQPLAWVCLLVFVAMLGSLVFFIRFGASN